ncbi:Lipopolysaccharide export system permease protein lptG [Candidatus Moranella endobia PCVAL]|nr:LPS export ABC transporter permease LptG [Candidatus Moranella endobia]AGJ61311.1 Lipopolysaccharide export system permease protein lptG [Candidatus Moranella endobia PCVAL]
MLRVLDRYIGKTIFNPIMMTLFLLVSLSSLIKFVEQMRKVGQGDYSVMGAGLFTLLSVPKDSEIFFPMATLIGTLLGLGSLATSSELVVMQAAGFSQLQVASSVMKTTIALVLLSLAIGEWVAPASEQIAYHYRNRAINVGSMQSNKHGLWAKDGDDFIFIERLVGNDKLAGVNIYHFDQKAERLQSLRYAATAHFNNGSWKLSQVEEVNLTNRHQINGQQHLNVEWETNLTPDKLGVIALPNSLSISGLANYVKYLQQSGQNFKRYQLKLWSKIFSPFSVVVMMLVALSFIFGPLRSVPPAVRFITGISCSLLFHVLDHICGPLGLVYNLPPVFGALLPSMVFMIISIVMLLTN